MGNIFSLIFMIIEIENMEVTWNYKNKFYKWIFFKWNILASQNVKHRTNIDPHCILSHVWLFVIPWTIVHEAPLCMGFFQARILEWVAICSSRGSSQPSIKPASPALQADSSPLYRHGSPRISTLQFQS